MFTYSIIYLLLHSFCMLSISGNNGRTHEKGHLFNGQTALFAPFGGQNKLGVETAVLGNGQLQTLPSHSEGYNG